MDTGAFVAILIPTDEHHERAVAYKQEIELKKLPVYVSNVTIIETHKRTLFDSGYTLALDFLEDVYSGDYRILRITQENEWEAKQLLKKFSDQKITFSDALNFSIMKQYGIYKAFAFDFHFNILGFEKVPERY